MSDAAFLAAIRAAPADDLPRLAYADYLDERGDPRGRFIQVQCALARLPDTAPARDALADEEWELLNRHSGDWLGDVPAGVDGWAFRRGFVERARVEASAWPDLGAALCGRWLLRDVHLFGGLDTPAETFASRWPTRAAGQQIERLSLWNTNVPVAVAEQWLATADLSALRSLDLFSWLAEAVQDQVLADHLRTPALRELRLWDAGVNTRLADVIARLPALDTLALGFADQHDAALAPLLADRGRWRELGLWGASDATAERVFTGDPWPRLDSLSIGLPTGVRLDRVAPPQFPALRTLRWSGGPPDHDAVGQFIERNVPRLRRLSLVERPGGRPSLRSRRSLFAHLAALPVTSIMMSAEQATGCYDLLARLPHLGRLAIARLHVSRQGADRLPPDGSMTTVGWAGRLRRLSLPWVPPLTLVGRATLAGVRDLAFHASGPADSRAAAAWLEAGVLPALRSVKVTGDSSAASTVLAAVARSPRLPMMRSVVAWAGHDADLTALFAVPKLPPLCLVTTDFDDLRGVRLELEADA